MNYKEKMLAELKGFMDMEALDGRVCLNFLEARLFYDLLIKDMIEGDNEMDSNQIREKTTKEEAERMKQKAAEIDMLRGPLDEPLNMDKACLQRAETKITCLFDTNKLMISTDYKQRFIAEYFQTKIRYEKLKAFNNKIEAARMNLERYPPFTANRNLVMPAHDCPDHLLENQQHIMGEYLHILELRAVIEGIDLDAFK